MTIDAPSLHDLLGSALSGGGLLVGGALALGIRHGIDWDHIAAITDITSTTSGVEAGDHHRGQSRSERAAGAGDLGLSTNAAVLTPRDDSPRATVLVGPLRRYFAEQSRPFQLGSLYALGHAAVVTLLGLLAIMASAFLPDWIDPVMGRVVGVTLIVLAVYLFYSLYRYVRGDEFHLRSRWMIVFAGARHGYDALMSRVFNRPRHEQTHAAQAYGARTAFLVGLIHGVGAETGSQALVIASVVGATDKTSAVVVLFAFVVGLLISNSFVTVATTTGFISSQRRQWLYAVAGLIAAVFSLVLGITFLLGADATLPDLGRLVSWIGGPES
ncbi:MAG: hypothetical protein EPO65_09220 [Dehalococcoidia bacterium]|nr:MAG: hypothetical protein EPO65_09220 [Dehalococcoidia bacterium]